MTQTKIEGKFYPLKNDEWLAIAKKLTHSELLVLYHLRTLEPFGDKLTESSTKDVAKATGISQRSVQRALIKLAELELIDLQIQKFAFRLRSQGATEMTDSDSAVAKSSPVSPTRQECREVVTRVANSSPVSRSQAETITTPDVQNSKTYSDLIKTNQTLSEGERENFSFFNSLDYWQKVAVRKLGEIIAYELPQPPALMDKWVMKNAEYIFADSRYYEVLNKILKDNGITKDPNLEQNSGFSPTTNNLPLEDVITRLRRDLGTKYDDVFLRDYNGVLYLKRSDRYLFIDEIQSMSTEKILEVINEMLVTGKCVMETTYDW